MLCSSSCDVRIGLAEGLEEILVVLAQEVGVALEHALVPEGQSPLVVERRDLAAIGRRVELLGAGDGAHIFRRPLAQVDRRRSQRRRRHQRCHQSSGRQCRAGRHRRVSILVIGILQILSMPLCIEASGPCSSTAGTAFRFSVSPRSLCTFSDRWIACQRDRIVHCLRKPCVISSKVCIDLGSRLWPKQAISKQSHPRGLTPSGPPARAPRSMN